MKLDWGTISDIVYDGIRFKKENLDDEADGIYALLAYDFESMTVFRIMSSSSVDYVFIMLFSNFLKSFDCKKDDEEIELENHDNRNHIVGLVGKNKMIM